jgi:hypothetical protein
MVRKQGSGAIGSCFSIGRLAGGHGSTPYSLVFFTLVA